MKTTLFFKRVDFFVQLAALLVPVALCCYYCKACYMLLSYVFLGIIQPISCLLNAIFLNKFMRDTARGICEKAALLWVAYVLLFFLVYEAFPELFFVGLMVLSTLIAILYLFISYREVRFIAMQVDRKQYI